MDSGSVIVAIAFAAFVVGAATAVLWMEWLRNLEESDGTEVEQD